MSNLLYFYLDLILLLLVVGYGLIDIFFKFTPILFLNISILFHLLHYLLHFDIDLWDYFGKDINFNSFESFV